MSINKSMRSFGFDVETSESKEWAPLMVPRVTSNE